MVELGEGVDEELPVAPDVGPVLVDLGHLAERVALDAGSEIAEVVAHRRGVVRVEVDEDEALPHLGLHGDQAVVGLVEVEELALLLHEGQRALEVVAPAVVLAGELTAGAARLFPGEVVPHELVAAMAADVVEAPDAALLVAHDDHRGAGAGQLLGEVAAGAGELLDPPDVQPRPGEDGLPLELVELGGDGVLVVDRGGAQLGVVLGPAALSWLREVRHVRVLRSGLRGRTIACISFGEKGVFRRHLHARSSSPGAGRRRSGPRRSGRPWPGRRRPRP